VLKYSKVCDDCGLTGGAQGVNLQGKPCRNSPRWLDTEEDVPDGVFDRWPTPETDPRPAATVEVPQGRSLPDVLADPLIDHLLAHPRMDKSAIQTLIHGMKPFVVGRLMVDRLVAYGVSAPSVVDLFYLLDSGGFSRESSRLRAAVFDRCQPFDVRSAMAFQLKGREPGIVERLADDLLDQAEPGRFAELVADLTRRRREVNDAAYLIADLFDAAGRSEHASMLQAIEDALRGEVRGSGDVLLEVVKRPTLASLRPALVEVLLLAPDIDAAWALEHMRDSTDDPGEARRCQSAAFQVYTAVHERLVNRGRS